MTSPRHAVPSSGRRGLPVHSSLAARLFHQFTTGRWSKVPPGARLSRQALEIWRERDDLRSLFDLGRTSGREGMFWWYLRHGYGEYGLSVDAEGEDVLNIVNRSYPKARAKGFLPVTWLMHGLIAKAPVRAKRALRDSAEQDRLLRWFFAQGLTQANLEGLLTEKQARILHGPDPLYPQLPLILGCLWRTEAVLQEQFPTFHAPAYAQWCATQGAIHYPILSHRLIGLGQSVRPTIPPRPFGVNLFGHARGRSGVSEDVRMASLCLTAAGIAHQIRNVPPGDAMPDEESRLQEADGPLPYSINLFAMTAPATMAAITSAGGAQTMAAYRNIGFWPWELPEMPEIWRHAYKIMDEIWASSHFTWQAHCRSTDRRVRHMPMAVTVEDSDELDRASLGLPEEKFLFGFAFDGLSGFARKAPLATIQAFLRAFPDRDEPVGLVIKTMRGGSDLHKLRAAVSDDERIHIMDRTLSRGSMLDLWRSIDCFVSLHRSEGFGRNIAEAMMLGKPVIVTAHSGNMDFTNFDTAALTPARLIPVEPGQYPFSARQSWAEPDIQIAAGQMQRMVTDAEWRTSLAKAGQIFVSNNYNISAVADKWNYYLRKLHDSTIQHRWDR